MGKDCCGDFKFLSLGGGKMKIAVDGYELTQRATGAGRVIGNLLTHLIGFFPEHEFFIFTGEKVEKYSGENVRQYVLPSGRGYFRWQNGPFFKKLKEIEPDILLASNYTLPYFSRWKSILIIHDISLIVHPEWYSRKTAIARNHLIKRSLKKANFVTTPSEFTKTEILRFLKQDPEKIGVIPLAVEERFRRSSSDEILKWKEKKGLTDKKIIGYVGSIFKRRNIPLLVEASGLLRKEFPEIILYVVGRDLTYPPQPMAEILNKDWIKWQEYLPDEELSLFYSALHVFAYLSEYEGFGLPPLEALACGAIPVLLNRTALREVYEDMAVTVDFLDPIKIKEALRVALTVETKRQAIQDKFSSKRNYFSWPRAASALASILKNLED
jgi:glycosyltransferase involved in cell wall biosynthesis